MAIRSRFARYLNPVLAGLRALGGSARPGEVNDWVAGNLSLTDEERAIQNQRNVPRFYNDVAWARFYLTRAGYLDASRRGVWTLTEAGRSAGTLSDGQIATLLRRVQTISQDTTVEPGASEDAAEAPRRTPAWIRVWGAIENKPSRCFEPFRRVDSNVCARGSFANRVSSKSRSLVGVETGELTVSASFRSTRLSASRSCSSQRGTRVQSPRPRYGIFEVR